jgi:hypothetical protein
MPSVERYEYKVLITRGDVRVAWFDGEQRLGGRHELEEILNRYAADGWRLVSHAIGVALSRIILERPYRPPVPPAGGAPRPRAGGPRRRAVPRAGTRQFYSSSRARFLNRLND